jgi:hypothetical protein
VAAAGARRADRLGRLGFPTGISGMALMARCLKQLERGKIEAVVKTLREI